MPGPENMPSILDREIDTLEADSFGHQDFAEALRSLIESPDHVPPYSIGLLGPWGSGKSTIKSLYLVDLRGDQSSGGKGKRSARVHAVTFNAWRYGGDNIKRALLRHVYHEVGGDDQTLTDAISNEIEREFRESRGWKATGNNLCKALLWNVAILASVFAVFGLPLWFVFTKLNFGDETTRAAVTTVIAVILGYLAALSQKLLAARYSNNIRIEPPRTSAEDYERLLIKQIKAFKRGTGKSCGRLVVFVDDLDRLSADEMVSGLDAIRTFMEMPQAKLPKDLGMVFVISCDENKIAAALSSRRNAGKELPGAVLSLTDARRYLDRIFQFRLEIPPFPKQDMRGYALGKLKTDLADMSLDLEKRGTDLRALMDLMIHVGVHTPRNALQILNTFAQSWWLAGKREFKGSGSTCPGALQEGTVTNHPLALGVLCALRVDFPDFYDDLQLEPSLIEKFTDAYIRHKSVDALPERTRSILNKHAPRSQSESKDPPPNVLSLKPEFYPLRRFLASSQSIQWPENLQPLLLLSQDSVTRKYGSAAYGMFQSMVSGDTQGVLAELSRDKDGKDLGRDDIHLLRNFWEDATADSDLRRDNAAFVLARLSHRLCTEQARGLLDGVATRLAQSRDLRCRIGLKSLAELLPKTHDAHQRHLAGFLIDDLMATEGNIRFTLESLQQPSLEEAVDMAKTACEIILDVRSRLGLEQNADDRLVDWLVARRVSVGGQEKLVPFEMLEGWMEEHQQHLLEALRDRYSDLVVAEFEGDRTNGIDAATALQRCREVFSELSQAGQEDRATLWKQLDRLVSVRDSDAVKVACETAAPNISQAQAEQVTSFIKNLAARLSKDLEDDEIWGMDWKGGAGHLLEFASNRKADIDEAACSALGTLAQQYALDDATAPFTLSLLGILTETDRDKAGEVISEMTTHLLKDLPEVCTKWLSQQFADTLAADEQAKVCSTLQSVTSQASVDGETAEKFDWFVDALPDKAIASKPMQGYLTNLFSTLPDRHANPAQYLDNMFPVLAPLFKRPLPGIAGKALQSLFSATKAAPTLFGRLHAEMAPNWPKPGDAMPAYNPPALFSDAVEIATQYPNASSMPGVLKSTTRMVREELVPEDKSQEVVDLACKLWPHHRKGALEAFKAFDSTPAPVHVASLMDGIDPADQAEREDLSAAWRHIGKQQELAQAAETTRLILGKTEKGTEDAPDLCFSIWIDAQKQNARGLLSDLLSSDTINDDQKQRAWLQAVRIASGIGGKGFLAIIPGILQNKDVPKTANSVFDNKQRINDLFGTETEKFGLAESLLQTFCSAPTTEAKRHLANWIDEIGGQGVLSRLGNEGFSFDSDDLAILKEVFPRDKHLRKLKIEAHSEQ